MNYQLQGGENELLIPGSSIYQVIQFSKLEKKYTDCLNALECSTTVIGSEFIAKLPHPEAEDFYNTCCAIDRLNAGGYLAFLAKVVTGVSIMILFAP